MYTSCNIERSIKLIIEQVRTGTAVSADFYKGALSFVPQSDLSGFFPYIIEAGGVLSDGSNIREDVRSIRAASDGDPHLPHENILICQEDYCAGPVMALTQTENGCEFKSFVFGYFVPGKYPLSGEAWVIECVSGEYTGNEVIFGQKRTESNCCHQDQAELLLRTFILSMSNKNIEVSVEERSTHVQQSRRKHGKPPLPAYRRIRLGSVKKVIAQAATVGHSQKSPHYRSGGWCYRKAGTRYWRKPCKVRGGGKNVPKYYIEYVEKNKNHTDKSKGTKKTTHAISHETPPNE